MKLTTSRVQFPPMVTASEKKPENSDRDYIFVCYSHADEDAIAEEIAWLRETGFSVWYDAEIPGGAEWNDELARRIQQCKWFLYFVSPHSVNSAHCRNELNYAQQHGRRMLAIELAPTEIPAGLQLMLNARQFLFRHRLPSREFRRRLTDALKAETDAAETIARPPQSTKPRSGIRKWLSLGLAALVVIAATLWFVPRFKSGPDLEFKERDWVVVGNLQNQTQDPLIGEALENSLRVALEQSKYASILPAATLAAAKQRMGLDPGTPLDRDAAIELAKREEAKVSILGNITQLGDAFTISIHMIEAADGRTVWVGSRRAENTDGLLPAIDEISRQVREQLGESLSSIKASSEPLAKVTTPNLEALRAYSLAEKSVATGDWEAGLELLQRALELDPEFAMAHGKMAAVYIAWARQPERAIKHYELALQNKSRLSPREQVYIEASSAWLKTPAEMRRAWKSMSVMFSNEAVGFNNLGEVLRRYFLDYEAALVEYRASTERRAPWVYLAWYNVAQCLLALGQTEEALKAFQTAFYMSGNPVDYGIAVTYTVMRRYDDALEFLSTANQADAPNLKRAAQFSRLWLHADRGETEAALQLTDQMFGEATDPDHLSRIHATEVALTEHGDDVQAFRTALDSALKFEFGQLEAGSDFADRPILTHLAILARVALRSGAADLAEDAIAVVRDRLPGNGFPVDQAWLELLEAEILLQGGNAADALEHTRRSVEQADLFQAHETLARAHQAMADDEGRTADLDWMRKHRGLAFVEDFDWFYGQAFNVLDWTRADRALDGS